MENESKSEFQIKCEQLCRPRPDRFSSGFVISPRKGLTMNPGIGFLCELNDTIKLIHSCGGVKDGDGRLASWAQKSISDLILHGKMATELVWKEGRDGKREFVGFAHVPALSIESSDHPGFSYHQVIDNRPVQGFAKDEMVVLDKSAFWPDSIDRCFTILESVINDHILKMTGPLGYLFEFSFKTEEAKESVEAREEKRETLIRVLREQLLHEQTVAAVKTDKAEQLKKEVKDLELDLKDQELDAKNAWAKYQKELLRANDFYSTIDKLKEQIVELEKTVGALKTENGQLNLENADKEAKIQRLEERQNTAVKHRFADAFAEGIRKATMEENTRLKLENQKLKGLIEEARKYVATANLMLS